MVYELTVSVCGDRVCLMGRGGCGGSCDLCSGEGSCMYDWEVSRDVDRYAERHRGTKRVGWREVGS